MKNINNIHITDSGIFAYCLSLKKNNLKIK